MQIVGSFIAFDCLANNNDDCLIVCCSESVYNINIPVGYVYGVEYT